jgi:hypothetical protein
MARMSDFNPLDPERFAPDPNFKAPDILGTVEGWRAWGVPKELPAFGVAPKLYSVTHARFFWSPRKAALADCRHCGDDVPGEHCSCGFYSAKSYEHLMSMGYHHYDAENGGYFHVVGKVANWGKVIEASQGWRAAKSYPVHLYVPYEAWHLAGPLRDAYGVPVNLKNILKPTIRRAI